MWKKAFYGIGMLVFLSSCVSAGVYKDLEARYQSLQQQKDTLQHRVEEQETANRQLENELSSLRKAHEEATAERDRLEREYAAARNNLENLQQSYEALEKNSSASIAENSRRNRELLAELEAKENALAEESARLEMLKRELHQRSGRVDELESLIASKDAAMQQLKDAVSKALLDFEGNGLTVEQRDGKVYVSMENKLLFGSGSWAVGQEGRRAVAELGKVLAQNPDISVLIEGHTDNVPYRGNGHIENNWDLSTKRATAIVRILRENPGIDAQNLTAAGRSEYAPVAPNTSPEGKAKNRRIEVILTPKLDEISRLLNEL
ncbi:OmpA/MotB family protein [Sinomicrobium soli]|uniref:OmpA/MotB family protein n=1 Tax=Sinomicrobium sp. N-1-3-6 TaxID=2219864 RepID=UPI000DCC00BF|nr:OmpA family protein [Sinomicrobium sp. N-1-3-6]RAV28523.1 cell envelope biogenesis protein OmpA [Sinomicrobium sp. N-1-3-6]